MLVWNPSLLLETYIKIWHPFYAWLYYHYQQYFTFSLWETDLQRDLQTDFVFNLHLKQFKMELFFTLYGLLRGQSGCWKGWLCRKEISWAFQGVPVCKPENLGGCVWKRKIQNSVFSYPACVMVLGVRWGETKVMGNPCSLNTGQCGQVLSVKP